MPTAERLTANGLGIASLLGAAALLLAAPASTPAGAAEPGAAAGKLRGSVRIIGDCTVVGVSAARMRELCGGSGVFRSSLGTARAGYEGRIDVSRRTLRGPERGLLVLRFRSRGTLVLALRGVFIVGPPSEPDRSSGTWRVTRATGTFARRTGSGSYTMVAPVTARLDPPTVLLDPRYVDLLHPSYEYRLRGTFNKGARP